MYVGCTSYRNLQTTFSQCISCSNKTFAGVQKLMGIHNGFTKYSATCTRSFLCLLTEVLPYFSPRYELEVIRIPGIIQEALSVLKRSHPEIKAIFMGTRHTDPYSGL